MELTLELGKLALLTTETVIDSVEWVNIDDSTGSIVLKAELESVLTITELKL